MLGITMEADVASFLSPRNMTARTFTNQTETLSTALFSEQLKNVLHLFFYFAL
jgi:hypothetical protein